MTPDFGKHDSSPDTSLTPSEVTTHLGTRDSENHPTTLTPCTGNSYLKSDLDDQRYLLAKSLCQDVLHKKKPSPLEITGLNTYQRGQLHEYAGEIGLVTTSHGPSDARVFAVALERGYLDTLVMSLPADSSSSSIRPRVKAPPPSLGPKPQQPPPPPEVRPATPAQGEILLARVSKEFSSSGWFIMVRCDDPSTDLFQSALSCVADQDIDVKDHEDEFVTELMARHQWQPMPGMRYTDFHYRRIRQHSRASLVGITVGGAGTNQKAYIRASALALAIVLDYHWNDSVQYLSREVLALQSQLELRGELSACMPIPMMIPENVATR
jgi:hypothetical protein